LAGGKKIWRKKEFLGELLEGYGVKNFAGNGKPGAKGQWALGGRKNPTNRGGSRKRDFWKEPYWAYFATEALENVY